MEATSSRDIPFDAQPTATKVQRWFRVTGRSLTLKLLGVAFFLGLWEMGGRSIAANPDMSNFADFAPAPTLAALKTIALNGELWTHTVPSLERIAWGIGLALLIGVPLGVAVGRFKGLGDTTHLPFQFLRMISPLAWMPIAIMVYPTWDSAIIFLITMASIWPLILSSAAGVKKIEPNWFIVARNLGAREWQLMLRVIVPAVLYDIFSGLRLAIGVAWIVIVPAEFLGVSSGLGYAINDARDTLEYDRLAAYVIAIGLIGYLLDSGCNYLTKKVNWVGRGD
ncbi:MAG: ABC transporter permease [Akkermansiaceae bacterium]